MATARERHPEAYRVSNEDTRKRVRTVPMQVLSMGYSRTGTMSLHAAYEILGIPSYHWVKMAENPQDIAMWAEALESKFDAKKENPLALDRRTFDMLMGHVGACTDQPAAVFAKELVAAYPEAKVVLVERDIDKWYDSFCKTVIKATNNPVVPFAAKIDRLFVGPMARVLDLATRYVFHTTRPRERWCMNDPKYFEEWRQKAKAGYLAHNEEVKRVTPPERLLVFKLEQGWEPLCDFLGKPVPDVELPNINDAEALNEMVQCYIAEGMKRGLIDIAKKVTPVVVLGLSVAAWHLW